MPNSKDTGFELYGVVSQSNFFVGFFINVKLFIRSPGIPGKRTALSFKSFKYFYFSLTITAQIAQVVSNRGPAGFRYMGKDEFVVMVDNHGIIYFLGKTCH